jgi:hypothetical protein
VWCDLTGEKVLKRQRITVLKNGLAHSMDAGPFFRLVTLRLLSTFLRVRSQVDYYIRVRGISIPRIMIF